MSECQVNMTGGGTSFEICKIFGKLKSYIGKTSSMIGHIWHALFAVKTCSGTEPFFSLALLVVAIHLIYD